MRSNRAASTSAVASIPLAVVTALTLTACGGGYGGSSGGGYGVQSPPPTSSGFADVVFVSDRVGVVATPTIIDANLSNPWGLATAPGRPF